jgi:TOBE domain
VKVKKGATTAVVKIEMNGPFTLTASITNEAADELSLRSGDSVIADRQGVGSDRWEIAMSGRPFGGALDVEGALKEKRQPMAGCRKYGDCSKGASLVDIWQAASPGGVAALASLYITRHNDRERLTAMVCLVKDFPAGRRQFALLLFLGGVAAGPPRWAAAAFP